MPARQYGANQETLVKIGSTLVVSLLLLLSTPVFAGESVSLAGKWRLALDRNDVGIKEEWCKQELKESISLPGSLPGQGIGDPVSLSTCWTGDIVDRSFLGAPEYEKYRQEGNIKMPFWLQPNTYYAGVAWYQRDIDIPASWKERGVDLFIERPHWETQVWVDGRVAGTNNSLATPHVHELGFLAPGKHRITVRVDNRLVVDVGRNSHSVSDHTQGNWNGMAGVIELRAKPRVWIAQQRVFTRNDGTVRVELTVRNQLFDPFDGKIRVAVADAKTGKQVGTGNVILQIARGINQDGSHVFADPISKEVTVKLDQPPQLWSEFNPALYRIESLVEVDGREMSDTAVDVFGFREIVTQGTQFVMNGCKVFFRGTLECCIFPKTGNPPTDVESWKRIISVAKAHGLNHFRFHSWCPPEAAFVAADELGFYYQVECSSWGTLGDGKPLDRWIYEEADRILKYYGNHPSFLLMAYGNEPGGRNQAAFLGKWVSHYKAEDARRLYTCASGWPQIPENQYHVAPDPRIQRWGEGLKSRINARPPETRTDYRGYIGKRAVPVISHEIGQWCAYPNFDEIRKYTGYLKPKNFERFRDLLEDHHMGDQAKEFLLASGKLQTLCYKEEIESALRTPGMGGFELLDLHDFPGQGSALVGVLDPFWESKGYVTPAEYSRFCNSTVPLARLEKRVFTTGEKLEADVEMAHFGPEPLKSAVVVWKLIGDAGKILDSGKFSGRDIPVDNGTIIGRVSVDLGKVQAPVHGRLVVGVEETRFENDWDIWIYPATVDASIPDGITVVKELNATALDVLSRGGRVLLAISPANVAPDRKRGKIALGFSSIFWNTAWTGRQAPHTLGILCKPEHPAFSVFPTEFHSNWQWWFLVNNAGAMILDDMPASLRPIVQVIDDWFTARRLGLVFEAKLGQGRLLVTSVDLEKDNPVSSQFRHSLLQYMAGSKFAPKVDVSPDDIARLMVASSGSVPSPK